MSQNANRDGKKRRRDKGKGTMRPDPEGTMRTDPETLHPRVAEPDMPKDARFLQRQLRVIFKKEGRFHECSLESCQRMHGFPGQPSMMKHLEEHYRCNNEICGKIYESDIYDQNPRHCSRCQYQECDRCGYMSTPFRFRYHIDACAKYNSQLIKLYFPPQECWEYYGTTKKLSYKYPCSHADCAKNTINYKDLKMRWEHVTWHEGDMEQPKSELGNQSLTRQGNHENVWHSNDGLQENIALSVQEGDDSAWMYAFKRNFVRQLTGSVNSNCLLCTKERGKYLDTQRMEDHLQQYHVGRMQVYYDTVGTGSGTRMAQESETNTDLVMGNTSYDDPDAVLYGPQFDGAEHPREPISMTNPNYGLYQPNQFGTYQTGQPYMEEMAFGSTSSFGARNFGNDVQAYEGQYIPYAQGSYPVYSGDEQRLPHSGSFVDEEVGQSYDNRPYASAMTECGECHYPRQSDGQGHYADCSWY